MAATRRRHSGFTLAEVLTAVLVMMVIGGTVVSIYQNSLRTWRTGTVENLAQQKASWAVQRIAQDLRQGMMVKAGPSPFEYSWISVLVPQRTFNHTLHAYMNDVTVDADGNLTLEQGQYIVYYRGNSDGDPSAAGDCLWRRTVALDQTTILKQDMLLANNVVDNPPDDTGTPTANFIYWPDINSLNTVEITITVQEKLGNKTAQVTVMGDLGLRNKSGG